MRTADGIPLFERSIRQPFALPWLRPSCVIWVFLCLCQLLRPCRVMLDFIVFRLPLFSCWAKLLLFGSLCQFGLSVPTSLYRMRRLVVADRVGQLLLDCKLWCADCLWLPASCCACCGMLEPSAVAASPWALAFAANWVLWLLRFLLHGTACGLCGGRAGRLSPP